MLDQQIVCMSEGDYTDDISLRVGTDVIVILEIEEWIEQGRKKLKGSRGTICYIREDNYENYLYGVYLDHLNVIVDFFPTELSGILYGGN